MISKTEAYQLGAFWLVLMCAYWFTMPPDITFEDTPLFAGACATLGLPHPPGYPAHTLYCSPFTQAVHALGFSYARGAAFASSFAAASACAMLAWLLTRMYGSRPASFLAAGLLALAPQYWSQAIIPEVYSLNAWMVVGTMIATYFYTEGGSRRWLVFLAFMSGFGLANHWPLYGITFPAFLIWLAPHWRRVLSDLASQRFVTWILLALLAGLSPYIHLLTVSPDSFRFDKEYDLEGFIPYVRRDVYGIGGNLLGFEAKVAAVAGAAISFVAAFQYVFGLVAVVGLALFVRMRKWSVLAGILWGMLSSTLLLAVFRSYESAADLSNWIFSVYPLQSYAFVAMPLALATAAGLRRLRVSDGLAHGLVLASLAGVAAYWWPKQDRSDEDIALPFARLLLASVPEDGLVIEFGNDFSFPIKYARYFNEGRPVPEIVAEHEYLVERRNDGTMSAVDEETMANEGREVAFVLHLEPKTFGRRYHGFFSTVALDVPPGEVDLDIGPESRELLTRIIDLSERGVRNAFTRLFMESALIGFVKEALNAQKFGADLGLEDQLLLSNALQMPEGQYALFLHHVLDPGRQVTLSEVENLARGIAPYMDGLRAERKVDIMHLHSTALIQSGDLNGGRRILEQALRVLPTSGNARVIVDLLQVYDVVDDYVSYLNLRRRFPDSDVGEALVETDARCAENLGFDCTVPLVD